MWGRGLYFASNAKYSDNYAHVFNDGTKGLFFAKVNLGKIKEEPYNAEVTRKFRAPPAGYDSV